RPTDRDGPHQRPDPRQHGDDEAHAQAHAGAARAAPGAGEPSAGVAMKRPLMQGVAAYTPRAFALKLSQAAVGGRGVSKVLLVSEVLGSRRWRSSARWIPRWRDGPTGGAN